MKRPGQARRFPRAGLATPHYLASATGLAVLAQGGNAVDAIVAANLALGVVAPYLCGCGGDLFAVVWDGRLHGYFGAGRAPAGATPEAVRARTGAEHMPFLGPHTVTVPQAVEGWFALLERWGTRPFGDLATAAVRYARDGFEPSDTAMRVLGGYATLYADFPAWQAAYGNAPEEKLLRQPALARLIELLGADGPDAYYEGEVADAIATAVQAAGGFLAAADLAAHEGGWVDPLVAGYRDVQVAELPPPTQGVTALEILRILDGFGLATMAATDRQHLVIEAAKLALVDRDSYVTDPDAMPLSVAALLDDVWIEPRRAAIDLRRAGVPEPGRSQVGGTAYLCAADADGLLVSLIQSNFVGFGSGIHVPEWGINLHNRGSSFSLDDGRVNVLAPRKRPMHTLIPAMALREGEPWLVFGSEGGDAQPQVHAQVLTRIVDDGADLQAALDAPRWRIDPWGWTVRAEKDHEPDLLDGLRARGHDLSLARSLDFGMGHAHAIERTATGYAVASDPRCEGAALGL
jgi:gamma-glutamyltranspeptidase / glutathione hydrolase